MVSEEKLAAQVEELKEWALKVAEENTNLREFVREMCRRIREWEQRYSIIHDQVVYYGGMPAAMLEAMESICEESDSKGLNLSTIMRHADSNQPST